VAATPVGPLPEPLRLPHGSVRGAIAVFVTLTYGYLLLQKVALPTVVVNAVVVVVAFYFGSHAASTPPGTTPSQPVAHPSRLVRILLLVGFAGLAAWFFRLNAPLAGLPVELIAVLEVLAGYVAGATVSWLVHRRARESATRSKLATIFRDLTAIGALALTAYICFGLASGRIELFFGHRPEDALSLVVTFYFGSRVIGH
jgi:hypothetical protein